MDKELSLGQKIRQFRLNAKLSQSELEFAINAAPGSISRIENDQVNPTKETLMSISNQLNLSGEEIVSLFGIDLETLRARNGGLDIKTKELETLYQVSNSLIGITDISELCHTIMKEAVKHINVNFATVSLWNETTQSLNFKVVSAPPKAIKFAEDIIKISVNDVQFSAHNPEARENYIFKCLLDGSANETTDFYNIGRSFVNRTQGRFLQLLLNMKLAIHIPMIVDNQKLGVFGVLWNENTIDEDNKKLLLNFANQAALAIYNLKCFYDKFGEKFE